MTKAKMHLRGWAIMAALIAFSMQCAGATNAPVLSGSYRIVSTKDLGARIQVRINIRLVNHGPAAVAIGRITLWDLAQPTASQACALTLSAHGTLATEQEFVLERSEYEMWRGGMHPRVVLEMPPNNASPGGTRKAALRLTPAALQGVK